VVVPWYRATLVLCSVNAFPLYIPYLKIRISERTFGRILYLGTIPPPMVRKVAHNLLTHPYLYMYNSKLDDAAIPAECLPL